jgi:hypothetical protein
MNILDVGDKLASVGAFILALVLAIGGYVNHRRNRRQEAASTPKSVPIPRFARTVLISIYVLAFSVLAGFADPDFVIFLFFGVTSFVIGDMCGQKFLDWINRPNTSDDPPARRRRVDAIATTIWIVLLVVLHLAAIVALFIYSPRADILVQVILTCVFCAAVTFLPYHADIRAGLTRGDRLQIDKGFSLRGNS